MRAYSRRPPQLRGRIFRGADAVRAGLLTRDDLRGPVWRRVFRGIYADAALATSHQQRCRAAAWYLLPAGAAIAGRSAASLYGIGLVRDSDPVEVVTPWSARFGPVSGLTIHVADLPAEDVRVADGVRRTSPLRTCWDLALWLPAPDAVAYLDLIVARRLATTATLAAYLRQRAGQRGWRRLLRAVSLVDPAAGSPQESRLRVRLVEAGLPKPVSQHVIEADGAFVGRVDLAWPRHRVALEYDGRWHDHPERFDADRARLNRLVTTGGWLILHATSGRLRDEFDGLVADIRAALRSRRPTRGARGPAAPPAGAL